MKILNDITHFIEANQTVHLHDYLTTQAAVGYKLILIHEDRNSTLYGEDFRLLNLSDQAIEDVFHGEIYHGMRDLPKETFVTGFFSDESANTVGTSFRYNEQTYALFLRPNIKLLFTEVHYLLGGIVLLMTIISLIAMLFVARKLIQPISELTNATKKIGAEQFSISLPTKRGDEIGELAISFQKMAEQLRESDQMKKQFINDVSHDFQTPLQNIKGYANLLEDASINTKERQQYTEIIQLETDRLSALTKQLLLLTSLDSLTERAAFQVFDVSEQLKNVIKRYRWLMEDKNISLTTEINNVMMSGNKAYIEKIWENLLSNALKYTRTNGLVHITLVETADKIVATFTDNGMGIDKKNIPFLFDRFYRVDEARQADIEGTGLGLAIVDQVVQLHEASVTVESKLGAGTTFTVYFPKK